MVSHGHRVVVEGTHHEHHRISPHVVLATVKRLERRTLDRVTRVDQQCVWLLLTNALNECRDFGEPTVIGFVSVVIYRVDVAVQIGRAKDRYLDPLGHETLRNENDYQKNEKNTERVNERREFSFLHFING